MRAISNKWDQENPEKKAASRSAYKQRVTGADGECSANELLLLRLMQERKCYYCEKNFSDAAVEKDHRIPLIRGGSNDASNIVYACRACNRDKGGKTATDFFVWRRSEGLYCRPALTCFFCESDIADAANVCLRIPIQRGGSFTRENLVWACPECNKQKQERTAAEYLIWRRQNGLKTKNPKRILLVRRSPSN